MRRKILTGCMILLLVIASMTTASAERFDPGKTGSIRVTLTSQDEKTPIADAVLCVYYVATVSINADGNLCYNYTPAFAQAGIAMDDPELAAKLDAYLAENEVAAATLLTDAEGTAVLDDLPLGLYFVRQTNSVEGFAPCIPFLVTVPMENEDGYVYEVNASPKTEVARLISITIRKVWNTDASTEAADRVTVQLLRNGNVVKTAILHAQNNWQVTYTGMPESDAYSIKEINVPKGFTATYSKTGYVFTATNTAALIQTGQLLWPIPVLAVSGMLLIAVGTMFMQKKRDTNG